MHQRWGTDTPTGQSVSAAEVPDEYKLPPADPMTAGKINDLVSHMNKIVWGNVARGINPVPLFEMQRVVGAGM